MSNPILAIESLLDKIFPSKEEQLQAQAVLEKVKQHPAALQVSLNKHESQHRSLLVAGWRPFIGWVCGIGLANTFIINPWLQWLYGVEGPQLPLDVMIDLVIAMLGLGTLRTFEKFKDKAK
ncbi:MAG: 3TM-type holin [Candidatus Berkiella sp.]